MNGSKLGLLLPESSCYDRKIQLQINDTHISTNIVRSKQFVRNLFLEDRENSYSTSEFVRPRTVQ